jgi:hypothetical protein
MAGAGVIPGGPDLGVTGGGVPGPGQPGDLLGGQGAPPAATTPTAPAPAPQAPPTPQQFTPQNQTDLLAYKGYQPAAGQPDPRDPTYYANLARLLGTSQQDYAAGQLAQATANNTFGQQTQDLQTARTRGITTLANSLIGKGLLRSGYHDVKATQATQDYLNTSAKNQSAKQAADAARQAQQAAILSNLGTSAYGEYTSASGRAEAAAATKAQQDIQQAQFNAQMALGQQQANAQAGPAPTVVIRASKSGAKKGKKLK